MSINSLAIKKLYGLSAGRCNICKRVLIEEDVQIGEMAHLIAKSHNGPRGLANFAIDNSYENLILLCSIHHKIVDDKPDDYSIRRLQQVKNDHEAYVFSRLNSNRGYFADLHALNLLFKYIPILELRRMAMDLPDRVSFRFEAKEVFNNFLKDNPHLYPFSDRILGEKWEVFLSNFDRLNCWIEGYITELKLVTLSEMLNSGKDFAKMPKPLHYIYASDNRDSLVLNKHDLSSDQINYVRSEVGKSSQEFIYSHNDLIQYVRNQFDEIEW